MAQNYAFYRFPYSDVYTKLTSDAPAAVLESYADIGRHRGFVIAPFDATPDTPILLLSPDKVETHPVPKDMDVPNGVKGMADDAHDAHRDYEQMFTTFHDAVVDARFHKIVLARCISIEGSGVDVENTFIRACQRYPRLMIQLFSTPQSGTWIIASPEILVEGHGNGYRTMALAGTMPYRDDAFPEWSTKNRNEQHIVEQYIENAIAPISESIVKDGPSTVRAGELLHLRTDFRFQLAEGHAIGDIIARLHPTPAVCGLPVAEARRFIIANEATPRLYYSGFAGPVGINGETRLYVSLRCAQLTPTHARLYAGGGIMPDSQCEAEWYETEGKAGTIMSVL